uniref:Complex I assembly factor TIMMDC1, mitochondrial n=1 Tax=Clastoptera arizonana TaxID=38151 RepID=A0A1B6CR86_9HEMI
MFRLKLGSFHLFYKRTVLIGTTIVTSTNIKENPDSKEKSLSENLQNERKYTETGWDRLRQMYSIDEFGNISKEANSVLQTTYLSAFIGMCYGGFIYSRDAYLDFLERNQATKFTDHMDAKRRIQNHVSVNFGIGAFKWGWRLSLFCGSFMLVMNTFQVYRGYTTVYDYVLGGAISGSLYQFKIGPRAMIVGGLVGGTLGLLGGSVCQFLLKLNNSSFNEVIAWQNSFDKARSDQWKLAQRRRMEDLLGENKDLVLQHDKEYEEIKKWHQNKENEEKTNAQIEA